MSRQQKLPKMKKSHKFILFSFIGPLVMTFFIAVFVLVMQFIWLYIDEMLGKGLEWYVLAELFFYATANVVPMAMPLAILLASIMTFGNLGEHFELVAFKSAGISLQKVMKPLIIFICFISIGAFYFANNVIPVANLKFYSLLHDIRSQKPAINIQPNVFYNEIDGYTIRVKNKIPLEDGREMLKDVMIYNHANNNGNRQVTVADSGIMNLSKDKAYFTIKLYHGVDYQEKQEDRNNTKSYPLTRFYFEENEFQFDISGFQFKRSDEEAFKHDYRLLNLKQLMYRTDSLHKFTREEADFLNENVHYAYLFNDSITDKKNKTFLTPTQNIQQHDSIPHKEVNLKEFNKQQISQVFGIAINNARTQKGRAAAAKIEMNVLKETLARVKIEWHRKFTFSIACLIMFFIGAPLGAIVRKGGLGMPVVISIIFFLIYYIISITGEKMAKELIISPWLGMWFSTFVLFPLGYFFTYKATTDSALFNIDAYTGFFKNIFTRKKKELS